MSEQKQACMFRLASSEQNSDSQTWTASIDAMRNYRGRDEWHLSAIEFHHKDRKEAEKLRDEWLAARCSAVSEQPSFQKRVHGWMMDCFSMEICRDRQERNHRFLEEALELVQACECTASEAHQLVDYVYGRDQGDINQEVGGVMVTLAALCLANDIDMHQGGEIELARILQPAIMNKIRAKQASKPKHSPLPAHPAPGAEPQAAPAAPPTMSEGQYWTNQLNACWDRSMSDALKTAAQKALNYIENTEGELGMTLSCGDALRAALADTENQRSQAESAK